MHHFATKSLQVVVASHTNDAYAHDLLLPVIL